MIKKEEQEGQTRRWDEKDGQERWNKKNRQEDRIRRIERKMGQEEWKER